jgi:ceramide glucosyltransferase
VSVGVDVLAIAACLLWPALELWRQRAAWRALRAMPRSPGDTEFRGMRLSDAGPDDAGPDDAGPDEPWRFALVDALQPIRGGDPSLADALGASLRALGGRGARLHWLIDEDDSAAADAVRTALRAQPALAAQVAVSLHPPCPQGINPKLFKLDRALAHCRGDTVLVLDDDARLPAATLDALSMAIGRSGEGDDGRPVIATALPIYLPARGIGARLLARFVNDNAAVTYLPPRLGGRTPTINGMCWAMRRDALLTLGGFAPQLRHLTDDLAMARAVLAAGGRIEQRSEPVWLRTDLADATAYVRQMHRWMLFALLLVRSEPRPSRLRIAFGQGLPTCAPWLSILAFVALPTWAGAATLLASLLLHIYGRRALQRACAGAAAAVQPLSSLLVALLLPLHLAHAALDRRIRWRAHRYRVHANDRFEEIG